MTKQDDTDVPDYLLGSHDTELQRLGFQHQLWSADVAASWRTAGFGPGHRLLDLGCGPGLTSVELARLVGPRGSVLAVDASQKSLDLLQAKAKVEGLESIETFCADVGSLALPNASLDGAYARWLFCFLKDPLDVLTRVSAALKPGARLVTFDYFNYPSMTFAPRSEAMQIVLNAAKDSWDQSGGSLEIQGELAGLGATVGLELSWVKAHTHVIRPTDALWNWPKSFFTTFLPKLVSDGLVNADTQTRFWNDWREREESDSSFLQLPPMYEIGLTKRPSP